MSWSSSLPRLKRLTSSSKTSARGYWLADVQGLCQLAFSQFSIWPLYNTSKTFTCWQDLLALFQMHIRELHTITGNAFFLLKMSNYSIKDKCYEYRVQSWVFSFLSVYPWNPGAPCVCVSLSLLTQLNPQAQNVSGLWNVARRKPKDECEEESLESYGKTTSWNTRNRFLQGFS